MTNNVENRHISARPKTFSFIATVFYLILTCTYAPTSQAEDWVYSVRPGDTLSDLSQTYLQDMTKWSDLQQYNKITNPKKIPPGFRLKIPVAWLKTHPELIRVAHAQGNVYFESPDAAKKPVVTGMTLEASGTLWTEISSSVTLEFSDGSKVLLHEESQLAFDKLINYGKAGMLDVRLRLLEGRMENEVKPVNMPSGRFEIKTPAALSSVRGTRFRIVMNNIDNVARSEVPKGRIVVNAMGQNINVAEGFGTVVNTGQPPTPPRPLLAAPDLSGLNSITHQASPQFVFPPLDNAVAYRAQILLANNPTDLLIDQALSDAKIQLPRLENGNYILRVRGIDELGLEGIDADHSFKLEVRPDPPITQTPEQNAMIQNSSPSFQWLSSPGATAYHFQLANNQHFEQPIFDMKNIDTLNWQVLSPLPPGVYYWRVASMNLVGDQGDFSPSQSLTVLETIATPPILDVVREDKLMIAHWQHAKMAKGYELHFSYDRHFKDPMQILNAETNSLQFRPPSVMSYYMRVRVIDVAGNRGDFGPTYHVPVEPSALWPFALFLLLIGIAPL